MSNPYVFNSKAVNHRTRVISLGGGGGGWEGKDRKWLRDGEKEETSRDDQNVILTGAVNC